MASPSLKATQGERRSRFDADGSPDEEQASAPSDSMRAFLLRTCVTTSPPSPVGPFSLPSPTPLPLVSSPLLVSPSALSTDASRAAACVLGLRIAP
eukprot:3940107-Rhodomonas_salina.2